jgi:hypothetical protein
MANLSTEDDEGKILEATAAPSSSAVAASRQPDTGPQARPQASSGPPSRTHSESRIDGSTSRSASSPPRLAAQPQPLLSPALLSPYTFPPVTLLVGGPASPSRETEPVAFYVHADLLTSLSPFFRAAFGSSAPTADTGACASSPAGSWAGFRESQTRTMALPEERPDDVRYLLQWLYWRAAVAPLAAVPPATPSLSTSKSTSPSPSPLKPTCPLVRHAGSGAGALYHPLIDPPLHALAKYTAERAIAAKAARHGDISQLIMPRPRPPVFGPLVRLWLLADRLDICGGLKDEVIEKVLEVSRVGNCVPGKEDVGVLWEGGGSVGGGKLTELVLDLYVGMRCCGVFSSDDDGGGGGGDGEEGSGGGGRWHEAFLRELVRRLMWELHGAWKGRTRAKEKDGGGGGHGHGDDNEGQAGDFVMVGRLKRRRCGYHEHG